MLPGWYGVGQAIAAFDDKALLAEMAEGWPLFAASLANMEQVLAKSDMGIAGHYAGLVEDDALREHRSEEHTSELQSLMRISYAVFCLTKKTKQPKNKHTTISITKLTKYETNTNI